MSTTTDVIIVCGLALRVEFFGGSISAISFIITDAVTGKVADLINVLIGRLVS
jgi:hypothetical protein